MALSLLVVTAAPDDRPSTETLGVIVAELERRPDVDVEVWHLRATPEETPWPGAPVVDSLREWWPARVLEGVGVPRLPAAMRGLRLRAWNRRVAPDAVVLDDGLGERVLVGTPGRPVLVARRNATPPVHADWEPEPVATPAIVLVPPGDGAPVPPGAVAIASPHVRDYTAARRAGEPAQRERTRELLGIDGSGPLVVGWGDDGWIDGPDLFVRALWALEHRHGVLAGGLWLGLGADPHEVDRLRAEADRCGVGDRCWFRPADTLAARCCGDAVFLPYRGAGDPAELLEAAAGGLEVVTFPGALVEDPAVVVVDHLDVDAAAAALDAALRSDRPALTASATDRLDVAPWVDRLLAAIDAAAVSGRVGSG